MTVRVGNLYRAKGGKYTKFWYVIAVRGSNSILLGLNETFEIISSHSYANYAMEERQLIDYIPIETVQFLNDI